MASSTRCTPRPGLCVTRRHGTAERLSIQITVISVDLKSIGYAAAEPDDVCAPQIATLRTLRALEPAAWHRLPESSQPNHQPPAHNLTQNDRCSSCGTRHTSRIHQRKLPSPMIGLTSTANEFEAASSTTMFDTSEGQLLLSTTLLAGIMAGVACGGEIYSRGNQRRQVAAACHSRGGSVEAYVPPLRGAPLLPGPAVRCSP